MAAIRLRNYPSIILAKAFKAEEGAALAAEIVAATGIGISRVQKIIEVGASYRLSQTVLIVDHPPTPGLVSLIEGLTAAGAEVYLRDHHADADKTGETVARCREILGDRAVISTRAAHPSCAGLIAAGEFASATIIADADPDGVSAAIKALVSSLGGRNYPEIDKDADVLDGPHTGKTESALSPLGFKFVRAWGAIPAFGAPNRDKALVEVVEAFYNAALGYGHGIEALDRLAADYDRKVTNAKALAANVEMISPQVSFVDATGSSDFDPPTLAAELERGVSVSVHKVATGPIAGQPGGFGAQISLARTKQGETAGIDLQKLVPTDWAKGPEHGVISNTPFLLHLSPEKWEAFRPILLSAVAG